MAISLFNIGYSFRGGAGGVSLDNIINGVPSANSPAEIHTITLEQGVNNPILTPHNVTLGVINQTGLIYIPSINLTGGASVVLKGAPADLGVLLSATNPTLLGLPTGSNVIYLFLEGVNDGTRITGFRLIWL